MPKTETIRGMLVLDRRLAGRVGPRLAAGRAQEIASLLLKNPRKAGQVIECLWDEDAGVANRAADAMERASYVNPTLLKPWKDALLGRLMDATENKLRWNLALMIHRTELTAAEADRAGAVLRTWLDDPSSIVKTCAMHGLAGLTQWNRAMLPEVLDMLRLLSRSGTPAMRARGRILLKQMEASRRVPAHTRPVARKAQQRPVRNLQALRCD